MLHEIPENLETCRVHSRTSPTGLYQVVIESSGFLLSIRGQRVKKNQVVLLVVYPKDSASFKNDLILFV